MSLPAQVAKRYDAKHGEVRGHPAPDLFTPTIADSPPPPSEGELAKEAVLADLAVCRAAALTLVRERLKAYYDGQVAKHGQHHAYVTGDDAATFYDLLMAEGKVAVLPRTFLGGVFRDGRWEFTGTMVKSKQPNNHARLLYCWRRA